MEYDKILLSQMERAGFDITKLPKNLKLHFRKKKFAAIPEWVVELANRGIITKTTLAIYANISLLCYNNKSFTWFSKSELAKRSGVQKSTVYRCINQLVDAGAIAVFTQKVDNNKEKSLIFILPERNIKGSRDYIKSIRGGRMKASDKNSRKLISQMTLGSYPKRHRVAIQNDTQLAIPNDTGSIRSTEVEEGKYKKGSILPNFSPTEKNFGHFVSKKERNVLIIANKLIGNYYNWVNSNFELDLEPRNGDYENAFDLIYRKGATPELFLQFIKENANDNFFLKSDKHFSVWTSDISIAKYSQEYRDIFLDEAN